MSLKDTKRIQVAHTPFRQKMNLDACLSTEPVSTLNSDAASNGACFKRPSLRQTLLPCGSFAQQVSSDRWAGRRALITGFRAVDRDLQSTKRVCKTYLPTQGATFVH